MADATTTPAPRDTAPDHDSPLLQHYPPLNRNRNFLLLWAGQIVAALGDRIHVVVMLELLGLLIGGYTHNPHFEPGTRESSQLTVMMLLPFLLFGPVTGIIADRFPRRLIMVVSDLARVVIVIIARLLFLRENHQISFAALYLMLLSSEFILATFAASFSPARLALMPELVHPDQLLRANSLTSAAGTVASLLGFVIGGWLVTISLSVAMFADAGTFLFSAITLLLMRIAAAPSIPSRTAAPSAWRELREALRYIRHHRRVLQTILLMFLFWTCGTIVLNGLTGIVTRTFGLDVSGYSYFMGVVGAGMVAGAAIVSLARAGIPKEVGIAWPMVLVGVFLFLFSLATTWLTGGILLIGAAFFGAVLLVSLETLLQRTVPNYIRGRVMGVKDVITTCGLISVAVPLALWQPGWGDLDILIRLVLRYLAVLVSLVGVWLVIHYYRRQTLPLPAAIVRRLGAAYLTVWHRFSRDGACTIPTTGPVIVVANHISGLDPLALVVSSPRRLIRFMMAREFYEKRPFYWCYKQLGAISVDRQRVDASSVRAALRVLRDGQALGLFPEGKISMTGEMQEARHGAAMLALASGAIVVPAYVSGVRAHDKLLWDYLARARLHVRYGPPLSFAAYAGRDRDKQVLEEVTARIIAAIMHLRDREGSGAVKVAAPTAA